MANNSSTEIDTALSKLHASETGDGWVDDMIAFRLVQRGFVRIISRGDTGTTLVSLIPYGTAAKLDREIAEAIGAAAAGELAEALSTRASKRAKRAKTIHIGLGLRDGIHTAGTALYLRKIRALGATVTLAKTGRVTVRDASGKVTIYTVEAPQNRAQADALLASNPNPESPLSRAYADLTR